LAVDMAKSIMETEQSPEAVLAAWVSGLRYEDLPADIVAGMKLLVRTIIGTAVAGATADGCEDVVAQVREWGGAPEASVWFHGGKIPAHAAALANSTMARALDICDFAVPGQHIGSSLIPVALGMVERAGGLSGRALIVALAAGAEIAVRLGNVVHLDGFDPTGVCSIFAPTIAAGRIVGLTEKQMANAMALAFNKAGSSFQSNVDASLAVRVIQGFVSQDAIVCAQLARRDITGPKNWLTGVWGYYHLFCKDVRNNDVLVDGLGEIWFARNFGYKTRPQCGATISSTDAVLDLLQTHPIEPDQIDRIDIRMAAEGPCSLVGSGFAPGDNPQVNGQFNVRYCVANAIVRKSVRLDHFTNEAVTDPQVGALAQRIHTHLSPELMEGRFELAARVAVEIHLRDGRVLTCAADGPSGIGEKAKTPDEHLADFHEHVAYGGRPLPRSTADALVALIDRLEEMDDVVDLLPLLAGERTPAEALSY
jgi:2-methylcitrate dehydratase PrpD